MNQEYESLRNIPPEPITEVVLPSAGDDAPTRVKQDSNLENFRYLTFMVLGVSLLWPWNCLLSLSAHYTNDFSIGDNPTLSSMFTSTLMTISTLSSLIINSYLTTQQDANLSRRIIIGSVINIVTFIVLAVLDFIVPAKSYGVGYFIMLMFLVFVSSAGTCLTQNGTMSMVQCLGPSMAQGVMVGQAIAGVLPSLALMVSNWIYYGASIETINKSTVMYLILTSIVTLVAGVLFLILENLDTELIDFNVTIVPKSKHHVKFMTLFEKLRFIALSIFTTFLFTLIFPVFAGRVLSNNEDKGKFFSNEIFIPFIFFIWNLGDLIGRIICSSSKFQINSDSELFIYSILRCLLIPLFFFCNLPNHPKTYIDSDIFYILLQLIFGLTNGHCLSLSFMNVSRYVLDQEREAAGAFCNVFLSLGLLAGSLLSYVFVWVI